MTIAEFCLQRTVDFHLCLKQRITLSLPLNDFFKSQLQSGVSEVVNDITEMSDGF